MKKILVLLSSYNGEKYIEEQIDSLLNQEGVEVSILVRDDGSGDGTVRILGRYEKEGHISLVRGMNMGWKKSFMELVCNSPDSDYYAFCDQDDIWLPQKLKVAVDCLEQMPSNVPNLYGSNLRYYKDGVDKGPVRMKKVSPSVQTALIKNLTAGCTMVFNKELRNIIQKNPPQIDFPHDYWVYQVASLLGNVYYDHDSYILYRQHDSNQLGVTISKYDKWIGRIKNMRNLISEQGRCLAAKELLRLYRHLLSEEDIKAVSKVACYKESFKNRLSLLFDKEYSMGSWVSNIGLKLRILMGRL